MAVESMGKRGRTDQVSFEDGKAAAKKIVHLAAGSLVDPRKKTLLPYPGIGEPPARPPLELYYVGTDFVFELLWKFVDGPRMVIAGPRGYGKSSDLRALAVCLYKLFSETATKERLVCIWNMSAAVNDLARVVRDAILFAYLVVAEAESKQIAEAEKKQAAAAAGSSSAAGAAEIQKAAALELEAEIGKIASVADAIEFTRRRKRDHQEVFYFFVDGWELIDEVNSKGQPQPRPQQRALVHTQMEALFAEGQRVWYSASAMANAVKPSARLVVHYKYKSFNAEQFAVYADNSILGKLLDRQNDIDFYTGRVPLLLDVLCHCCTEFGGKVRKATLESLQGELAASDDAWAHFVDRVRVGKALQDSDAAIVELLEDDANWNVVLRFFREHEVLTQVEESAEGITLDGSCHSIADMGKKDATYFVQQEQRYCSSYVQKIYMKALQTKEAQFHQNAGGQFSTKS